MEVRNMESQLVEVEACGVRPAPRRGKTRARFSGNRMCVHRGREGGREGGLEAGWEGGREGEGERVEVADPNAWYDVLL